MAHEWQGAPGATGYSSYPEVYSESHYRAPTIAQATDGGLPEVIHPTPKWSEKVLGRFSTRRCLISVLSITIFLLFAATVGLAAGVGVLSRKANTAESRTAALLSNDTDIDRGCSSNPESATGTFYTSQAFGSPSFKILCNTDIGISPVQSLFVSNFDDCIDACASYSFYTAGNFPGSSPSDNNLTCNAVSFITQWTNRSVALSNNAPGNCYLKPGPLANASLSGGEVHIALLQS
ncbi:hypothetical protein GGR51DRAFT_492002 [Nemania sp. FL0031]|nr:hypothetical protein GGR51DRAFT_492002 [Nemania sp. FL0031]